MAALDYAFLADFARVDPNGTLTVVGASWFHVQVASVPSVHRMAIAGRVRARMSETEVPLRLVIEAPGGTFTVGIEASLSPGPDSRPYGDGLVGHLFAVDSQIPLPTEGLYSVEVFVDGVSARRLAFDVSVGPPVAS